MLKNPPLRFSGSCISVFLIPSVERLHSRGVASPVNDESSSFTANTLSPYSRWEEVTRNAPAHHFNGVSGVHAKVKPPVPARVKAQTLNIKKV